MNFFWCVIFILFALMKSDCASMNSTDSEDDDRASIVTVTTSADESKAGGSDLIDVPRKSRRISLLPDFIPSKKKKIEQKQKKTINVAVCGGGIAGVTIAAFLSNISEQNDDVIFNVYIFERYAEILKGTSQLAHVLHAGAGEYWNDAETIADCQQHGEFYRSVLFPSMYERQSTSVLYTQPQDKSPREMNEARKAAKKMRSSKKLRASKRENVDSQQDVSPEVIKKLYKSSSGLGNTVFSKNDILMKNAKRDAGFKRVIKDSDYITVVNNYEIGKIIKNGPHSFSVENTSGVRSLIDFEHVFLTVWDQTDRVLQASFPRETHLPERVSYRAQGRVMALFDIRDLSAKNKTAIMKRPDGGMFLPRDSHMAVGYRCLPGASYPREGEQAILPENILAHGELIAEELRQIFGFSATDLKLAGAIQRPIVTRTGEDLSRRSYMPPIITPEGVVVAVPLKATFAPSVAMDSIRLMLENMSSQHAEFSEKWIEKVTDVYHTHMNDDLPEVFRLNQDENLDRANILAEDISFIQGFERTHVGNELLEFYQRKQGEVPTKLKRSITVTTNPSEFSITLSAASEMTPMKRSSSDPYGNTNEGLIHSSSWAELSVSSLSGKTGFF